MKLRPIFLVKKGRRRRICSIDYYLCYVALDSFSSDRKNIQTMLQEEADLIYDHILSRCPPEVLEVVGEKQLRVMMKCACEDNGANNIGSIIDNYLRDTTEIKNGLIFNLNVTLRSAAVLHYSNRPEAVFEKFNIVEELFDEYPTFRSVIGAEELHMLLRFRNMMRLTLNIIPPHGNMSLIMSVCTILAGRYNMIEDDIGSCPLLATLRRMLIFEIESSKIPIGSKRARTVYCADCGTMILFRSVWKHRNSSRHRASMRVIE